MKQTLQACTFEDERVRCGRQFRVSADRTSAVRKVRYIEGSKPDTENCRICQISS